MRKIKPAITADRTAIAEAVSPLCDARTLLRSAGADRACWAATGALDGAKGAFRHVSHRITRTAS